MLLRLAAALTLFVTPVSADVPRVAADILPVHSLVARVMEGVGEPDLILPPGASPHGYAMRPSEAAALERSDIVFWVGHGLTPWLAAPIETLAAGAESVELLKQPGTSVIEHAGNDHGHGHDAHDHGEIDPHAWLDPDNGRAWLDAIAGVLAAADPDNAARYLANAEAARAELSELATEMETALAPLTDRGFAVYHDALGYLEARFGIVPRFALLSSDADRPAPRRIAEVRRYVLEDGVRIVFTEPQANTDLIDTVFEGVDVAQCEVDLIGAGIPPGPSHYRETLRALASTMSDCSLKRSDVK